MKKKYLNPDLHNTRDWPRAKIVKVGLPINKGEGFSKKANMHYRYTSYHTLGKTNILEYY